MSAVPLQSMHAHHARHIRHAFNKRHEAAVAVGSLHRSQSSDARLDDCEHLHHHHRHPTVHHQQRVQKHVHRDHQSASMSPSPTIVQQTTTKSEPASRRSHSPVINALRPEAWKFNVSFPLQPVTWTCSTNIGQRLVEMASQGFGGSVRS